MKTLIETTDLSLVESLRVALEGEGIDATKLGNGRLHVLTVDVAFTPVWMGNLAVAGTDRKAK